MWECDALKILYIYYTMKNLCPVFILILSFVFTPPVYSQWSRTGGPSGGYVYAIHANSQYLFAGTKNGIYRSGDDGVSWQRLNNGLPEAFFCYEIKSSGNNILLWGKDNNYNEVSNHDVFKSNNNGEDWVEITLPDTVRILDEIALYDNKIFIAEDNILKTEDDGLTWLEILPEEMCTTVKDMEVYDDKLLVQCYKNLLVTSDFGDSWINLTVPKGEGIFLKDTLMILMGGINAFRSVNNGTSWEAVSGW